MRTYILAFASMMLIVSPVFSQDPTIAMRLKALEADVNATLSVTTALKAGQDAIDQRLDRMEAKQDAFIKASGVKLSSVQNWAGDPEFIGQPKAATATSWGASSTMSYSSMGTGAGGCATGSCSSGAGRTGLFGRRR